MIERFQKRLEWQEAHGRPHSKLIYTQCMMDYYTRVKEAQEQGKPLAITSILFYPEILLSMGVVTFAAEQYAIQLIASGLGLDYIDKGEAYGFPKEGCSPQKATIGLALEGILPKPDFIVATAQSPCDSSAVMIENLVHIYQSPIYFLNLPYRYDDAGMRALKAELEDLITFVEGQTGLKYDPEKLREFLNNSKEAHDYYLKAHALRARVPTPLGGRDSFSSFGIRMFSEGMPETVEFMKAYYEETLEKAEQGEGAVPNERFRVLVNGAYPFWDMPIFDWMEKEFGAVLVSDLHTRFLSTPVDTSGDPLEALARKALISNMGARAFCAPYTERSIELAERAKEYGCNASIYFANFGCKQGCGLIRVVSDAVREYLGVPTVIVEDDAGDPRIVSDAQMKATLAEYFKMLAAQRST